MSRCMTSVTVAVRLYIFVMRLCAMVNNETKNSGQLPVPLFICIYILYINIYFICIIYKI